ncbi:prodigiosin synthesizing transferase PigC-like [Coccinella septempunctata]|uniref:prodigiosin synthesizing transferase PigC-like n=1 Tax=Coccinella septempunctata TaxID=41139 RepID=UPI001D083C74|nr:prodigiosin synthesizing transferase PigC-like [Coccinella septempunctata]
MLSLVFNFCYYATLVVVPVVVYLLINDDDNFHSKGGVLYLVKFIFGKREIQKACKKVKIPKKYEELERYDRPKPITRETKSEALTFRAVDQEGNQLSVKITLLADHIAESTICLRIGKDIYVSPDAGGVTRRHVSGYQWKCQGLNVEISEPFKRYRLLFNGFLRKVSTTNDGGVEHISLRLTWNCCSKPNFSLVDDDLNLLAKCLAKTTWRDGNWLKLLGDEKSIVQFGALKGTILGDNIPETQVNMACVRTKIKGTADIEALNKDLTVFAATENGYLLHLGVKSIKNGCQELKYGHVLTHLGSVYPVKNCDLDLRKGDQSISDKVTIHVEVPGKMLKVVLSMDNNSNVEVTNDNFKGFKSRNVSAECIVNNNRGFAILDYWTSHRGNGVKRPSPILREIKVETVPDIVVTPIGTEESKILELTGGKGSSLSLMKSLENEEITIPDGFIVTTEAFKKQVEYNFNLRKSISLLEDIAFGREKGDLKNACEITVELFRDQIITPSVAQKILDELMKHRRIHDDKVIPYLRWAVRSSAVGEDSEEFSSAGQNETFLGSQTDKDVLTKICKCWASLFTYQSVMYRKQHGLPIRTSMAVVVQQMIPAESSGVLFTCHPSNSDPSKMVVTSNFGLGETVVSGESEPDTVTLSRTFEGELSVDSVVLGSKIHCLVLGRYGIHKHTGEDRSGQRSLTESQAVKLGKVGVILEEAFGSPRDVEWAFFKDRLYVLQSRPVTTLNQWTDEELTHEFDSPHISNDTYYTRANIGEVSPYALTALSYSAIMCNIDKGTQVLAFGRYDPYVSINLRYSHHFAMLELFSAFYPRPSEEIETFNQMVDLAIFGRPVLTEEMNRKAIARYGSQTKYSKLLEAVRMLRNNWNGSRMTADIVKDEEGLVIGVGDKDDIVDVYEKIDKALVDFVRINYKHCLITSISMVYQFVVLQQLTKGEIKMENYSDIATILSCCGDVISADVPAKLEEMSAVIRRSKLAERFSEVRPEDGVGWLKTNCAEVYDMLGDFLDVHGHRLLGEMELSIDSWSMDPSAVIKMLQMNCKFETVDKAEAVVSKDIVNELKSPISNATKHILRFLIKRYRKAVGYREISKSTLIKTANKFRIAYKTLARKMKNRGLIPDENLIYHLTQYEIWQIIHGKNPALISKALRRQRLYPTWNKLKFPEVMMEMPVPVTEDEEIFEISDSDVVCTGTPVCVGEVEGRAAVVTSLDDVHLLRQGDVLITKSTDIGWSPYFPMLSGVVTELGGLVSHGAVVAREYGLPCIVGAQNATRMFKTGDKVVISGKNGVIKLLSR